MTRTEGGTDHAQQDDERPTDRGSAAMSTHRTDGDQGQPARARGGRMRVVVLLAVLLAFVVVFGYLILVGNFAG